MAENEKKGGIDGLQNGIKSNDNIEEIDKAATIVIPPDGGFAWIVMMASFCCNLVVDGIVFCFGMFIKPIEEDTGATKAQIALIGSLLSGFYLIVGPFVSALTNRYGFRLVTIMGSIIASSAFVLCAFVPSVNYLYILYGVFGGIGFCFIYMPSVIIVGYYFEKWRPLATGIALCGSGVGTFVMGPISNMLIKSLGWRGALLTQGGMILMCAFFALAYRPIEPTVVSEIKEEEEAREKKLLKEFPQTPAFTRPLPEGRFSYSVPNSSHNTWMGTANNTSYPTAAEIFKGSGINLERRPSQNLDRITQVNFSSTSKKLEQIKQGQKRSGHVTPTEEFSHPPHVLSINTHELVPVGEAEEPEENETGTLLDKNQTKITVSTASERRHTVSGRKDRESLGNTRRGSQRDVSRPMYRDDIFFSGSLAKLPQYRSQTSLGYHLSVTHIPTQQDIAEEEAQGFKCKICPEAVRRTLSTMLDVSLLKNLSFILLAISGFFTMLGFFVPFIYIKDRAELAQMDENTAVLLLSALGIFNTIARIVCGWLSSLDGISALMLNNIFITAGGLATMFSGYFMSVAGQYIYTAIFGITCACFSALRSIIAVELLGLEKLTNAFGILLLFQGIAAVFGSPLAGFLYTLTNSYDLPFYVAGGLITFSGILCFPLNFVKRWQETRGRKVAASA